METKIDISVVIPMYNSEKYIESTISSILSQEKHGMNYEIIIVDDVSTDNSRAIVKNIKNERIRLIELKKNKGSANARNTGIKSAKGEWIQFIDSDDRICNNLYKKFENSLKPEFNCYLFSLINEYNDFIIKQTILDVIDKRAFAYFGGVWNKFIKKEICIEFEEISRQNEDTCFIYDMMIEKELKILLIEDAYYLYNCRNEHSKMANFNKEEYLKMFLHIYNQIEKCDDITKMSICDTFIGILLSKITPFSIRLQVAIKTFLKLYKYAPNAYRNGFGKHVITVKIKS